MTENVARLSSGYIKYFLRDGNGNRKYYLLNTGGRAGMAVSMRCTCPLYLPVINIDG